MDPTDPAGPETEGPLFAQLADAYRDGRAAAASSAPRRCPFDGSSTSAAERVRARMWARGFSAGNPFRGA